MVQILHRIKLFMQIGSENKDVYYNEARHCDHSS